MTASEKFESAMFGATLIIGLPAMIILSHWIAG